MMMVMFAQGVESELDDLSRSSSLSLSLHNISMAGKQSIPHTHVPLRLMPPGFVLSTAHIHLHATHAQYVPMSARNHALARDFAYVQSFPRHCREFSMHSCVPSAPRPDKRIMRLAKPHVPRASRPSCLHRSAIKAEACGRAYNCESALHENWVPRRHTKMTHLQHCRLDMPWTAARPSRRKSNTSRRRPRTMPSSRCAMSCRVCHR
jgi:hypothetical protein